MSRKKKTKPGLTGMALLRSKRGLLRRIALTLKISPQAVSDWDVVPIARLDDVEQIARVSRVRLRPDIFERRKKRPRKRARR